MFDCGQLSCIWTKTVALVKPAHGVNCQGYEILLLMKLFKLEMTSPLDFSYEQEEEKTTQTESHECNTDGQTQVLFCCLW